MPLSPARTRTRRERWCGQSDLRYRLSRASRRAPSLHLSHMGYRRRAPRDERRGGGTRRDAGSAGFASIYMNVNVKAEVANNQ